MTKIAHVDVQDISFTYPVFEIVGRSLKISLLRQMAGGKVSTKGVVHVDALSDISFSLKPGDRLGLIGHNGSGKSTLLRVLSGIAHPQKGRVKMIGRVVPLIEKGIGINPELSGEANIELPLRLLGATSAEVARAQRDIPEFTGLGAFMQLPVRTYSEGMRTRLSFAICTALEADILVLDEWLSAGDIDFHERASARLTSRIDATGIVVMASHSLELVATVCNKVAWLDGGRLAAFGEPGPVIDAYVRRASEGAAVEAPVILPETERA
jgi:ABC-type polysaccharide/polyol phosphate transport system ATPase subunit